MPQLEQLPKQNPKQNFKRNPKRNPKLNLLDAAGTWCANSGQRAALISRPRHAAVPGKLNPRLSKIISS